MTDTEELRQALGAVQPEEVEELLDRLEAAEKERDALRAELLDARETVRELFHGAGVANMTITTLRAKIEAMEQQEPAMWANSSNIISAKINKERRGAGDQHTCSGTKTAYHDAPSTSPPGAQPKLDEIKIALQRALELGKRETWTGAKKHRSWEDQREEQQCWDKVWTLLDAKGA